MCLTNIEFEETSVNDKIVGIIFDFDGVILESAGIKTDCYRKFAESIGECIEEFIQYHIENGGISRHIKIRHYFENLLSRDLSEEDEKNHVDVYTKCVVDSVAKAPFVPGAKEFIKWASQKVPLDIISGTPQNELDGVVSQKQLGSYFDSVKGYPTTKPERISELIQKKKCRPSECVYVGDALSDYEAAQTAECRFIGRMTSENTDVFKDLDFEKVSDLFELRKVMEPLL